ncbi:MAG: methionine synthase, partial [Deltaproteobacteria bacterium]|nr:methionine synthase [Deltaproteobacteria bacterium]
ERADMERLIPELARQLRTPLVVDSTDPAVVEAALERYGGRGVVNSVNLEDGPQRAVRMIELARRHGAALVALAIDEQGMALTTERKLAVAERIYRLAVMEHGLAPGDLIFDLLTFTVASGDAEARGAALATLQAVAELKRRHPEVLTVLGVSNVSFGLGPPLRRVLNSVFLAEATACGLDMAIVDARRILPLHRVDPELLDVCRRLLLADASRGDPLAVLLSLSGAADAAGQAKPDAAAQLSDEERLQRMVLDGTRQGLPELLERMLADGWAPLELCDRLLIPAMKEVGELFGRGQMQLPFVLQSAEATKAAVSYLEPRLRALGEARRRGRLVLATVRGDVHDIGKNLVSIILSNNGYEVTDLGIKVGIEQMLEAVAAQQADALGMSGLLVKSTVIMKENLEEMVRRDVRLPVLLGGAALTREFVERDLRAVYGPAVYYCEDAFAALRLLDAICPSRAARAAGTTVAGPFAGTPEAAAAGEGGEANAARSERWPTPAPPSLPAAAGPLLPGVARAREAVAEVDHGIPVPVPPHLGARVVEPIPLEEVYPLLDETALLLGRWRYRRGKLDPAAHRALLEQQILPMLEQLKRRCQEDGLLRPRGIIGYFPCHAEGCLVAVHDPTEPGSVQARFAFPRQRHAPHRCIADYVRPGPSAEPDVL